MPYLLLIGCRWVGDRGKDRVEEASGRIDDAIVALKIVGGFVLEEKRQEKNRVDEMRVPFLSY